ncbi:MAG: acyl-CoA thioesterase [Oscillospiraceae bacterium]|nr:acyl-CoA thioesterase [Oscillospiraceae bacterium]
MEQKAYLRPVHYYETDQMAIVHHSNYIRWFEEARLDLMEQIGISYADMEEKGILIPVVDVSCKYLVSAKYGDTVSILPVVSSYNGVKMCFDYQIKNAETEQLLATGSSCHCFLNKQRMPISLRRQDPQLHECFASLIKEE